MPSETFNLSVIEMFFISPNIMVEGITPDTLERFCHSFLFAGTCYRALNNMATPDINSRKFKYPGYVFAVLFTPPLSKPNTILSHFSRVSVKVWPVICSFIGRRFSQYPTRRISLHFIKRRCKFRCKSPLWPLYVKWGRTHLKLSVFLMESSY